MNLTAWEPRMLAVLRIVTGLIFLQHGTQKLLNFPLAEGETGEGPAFLSIFWIGGVMELVGGALIIIGLFTRPVALLLAGEMAVAYWMFHAPNSFYPILNGGEAAILYCFVFLYLFVAGAGALSVDAAMNGGERTARRV